MYCVEKLTVTFLKSYEQKQFSRHYSTPEIRAKWIKLYKQKAKENDIKIHFFQETIYINQ